MDLTITIDGQTINTTLYEKKLNIHQYTTLGSAHLPGVLTGLVLGNTHQIYSLCTQQKERERLISLFYHILIHWGYKPNALDPLFQRAQDNSRTLTENEPVERTTNKDLSHDTIFIHSAYHPDNPSSSQL